MSEPMEERDPLQHARDIIYDALGRNPDDLNITMLRCELEELMYLLGDTRDPEQWSEAEAIERWQRWRHTDYRSRMDG